MFDTGSTDPRVPGVGVPRSGVDSAQVLHSLALAELEEAMTLPGSEVWDLAVVPDAERLARATCLDAGVDLHAALDGIDASALSADDAVTYLQQVQRVVAHAAGVEAEARLTVVKVLVEHFRAEDAAAAEALRIRNEERVAAGLTALPGPAGFVRAEDSVCAELSAAVRLSPATTAWRIQEAFDLDGPWWPLLSALLDGAISLDHVRAIARELRRAPGYGEDEEAAAYAKLCAKVLAAVVPFAATHAPGQSARKTALLVTAADPAAARRRRRKAAAEVHDIRLDPGDEPGSCRITADLPITHGYAVMQAVEKLASDSRFEVADGCVTRGQHRVAALVALVLGDPGSVARVDGPVAETKVNINVSVLVPIETLVGASDQGGRIGSAPVPGDLLREVVAACGQSSTIRRLVTYRSGVVLDAGRSHYLGSDVQKLVIRLRDGYCRGVACDTPAWRPGTEIDHARRWVDGGETSIGNLGCLCKYHHQLKTFGGWQMPESARDGTCTWKSPLGRIYEHEPPDLVPPPPSPSTTPPRDLVDAGTPCPF